MKFLAAFFVLFGFAGFAAAAEPGPGPEAVVTEMYQTYFDALNAADASGSMENMPDVVSQVQKYATPELAARLAKVDSHPEPVIDWDFLISGQDFKDLKLISVKLLSEADGVARVHVEAQNFETKSDTEVVLNQTENGWGVADLIFGPGAPDSMTLDEVLKESGL